MENLIGVDVGRYHVVERLGEGGMAVVYKAYDTRLDCEVAIKFIRHEQIPPGQWQKMLIRFEHEAKRMAQFTHPNIVKVIDYGEFDRIPYIVMEYLPGGTLKERMASHAGKPMDYREAVRILAPVARALEFVHARDTIHRDIKPSNILLTDSGQPMLTDFGVAKILDLDDGQTLTGTGVGLGTPKYMAPEQWQNHITSQTDVYALGVVLYELVTGKVPYDADTPAGVLVKQLSDPLPRPKTLNPNLPEIIEHILDKALAKDPLERYSSMGELATALENVPLGIGIDQSNLTTMEFRPSPNASSMASSVQSPGNVINIEKKKGFSVKKILPILLGCAVLAVLGWGIIQGSNSGDKAQEDLTRTIVPSATVAEQKISNPVVFKNVRIATQSPLSGGLVSVGADIKNGAQLAVEQLGKPLEDLGFKVELAPYDDKGDPNTGVANAREIVADPSILCVVGHYLSGVQIPSSEEYHIAGLANVSPANTNPKVTDRDYWEVSRIIGRDDVQGQAGAQFAKSKSMTRAYIVHDKTVYGQGAAEFFKKEAETQGIKVVGFKGTEEQANFSPLLTNLLAANPDVVYFGGMYDQAGAMFKQAREKGYKGMFLSDDGFDSSDAMKIGGPGLLDDGGTFYTVANGPANIYPRADKFIADFKTRFGHVPQPFAAQAYDAAAICMKAIEDAVKENGNQLPTRAVIANAVRSIKDYQGITGTINFNKKGDLSLAKYYVIQVISADPEQWIKNPVVDILDIVPPE